MGFLQLEVGFMLVHTAKVQDSYDVVIRSNQRVSNGNHIASYDTYDDAAVVCRVVADRLSLTFTEGYSVAGEYLTKLDSNFRIPISFLTENFSGHEYAQGKYITFEDLLRTGLMEEDPEV